MEPENIKYTSVDDYIASRSEPVREKLTVLREIIRSAAPLAQEVISYNMPAYKLNGILVYFAAHSSHIGFYPTTSAMMAFSSEISKYGTSKGTIRFPLDRDIPDDLIRRIVWFRVRENLEKVRSKKKG